MIAAARRRAADDLLRRLTALGARVECRDDKIVLRAGARPVPPDLVAAARGAKSELSKMLNSSKMLKNARDEQLRREKPENPSVHAALTEGAQPSNRERLRESLCTFRAGGQVIQTLAEDAHLSAFDEGEDFCGLERESRSKALNRPNVSIFGAAGDRRDRDSTLLDPVLLGDGRRLRRFQTVEIPATALPGIQRLIDEARWHHVVLVADGLTLVVVEPWLSNLSPETLAELRDHAGAVIALLRGESGRRTGGAVRIPRRARP